MRTKRNSSADGKRCLYVGCSSGNPLPVVLNDDDRPRLLDLVARIGTAEVAFRLAAGSIRRGQRGRSSLLKSKFSFMIGGEMGEAH